MVEVRRLSVDEWQVWRDVRLTALADAPGAFTATLEEWADADESRWRARFAAVPFNAVAFREGRPIGQVSGLDLDEHAAVTLLSLWVAPEARGLGVARALVDAVIAEARSTGAASVYLRVFPTNTAAIALFERCGFVAAPCDLEGLVAFRYPLT